MCRRIWKTAWDEYRRFIFSKSFVILLFSIIFIMEEIVEKIKSLSLQTDVVVGKTEAFLLIMSHPEYAMLLPLVFIVILSNFPDSCSSRIYTMIRNDRTSWLLGELLYACMSGLTCMLVLLLASILWMGKAGQFMNRWSDFMTVFYQLFPEEYMYSSSFFIQASTVAQGTPLQVLLQGLCLMLGNMILIALLMAMFKMLGKRWVGLISAIMITVIGAVGCYYFGNLKWMFPMAHAIYGLHFVKFYAKPECYLWWSYLYYLIIGMVLLVSDLILAKRIRIGDEV